MTPEEYPIGELTVDRQKPTLFRVVTVHGEHWAFEFTEDARGAYTRCTFIDEDAGVAVLGVRADD